MLKDLHIKNYRLFEDFKMEGLAQVNLIAGKNNTGKTALLEALRIWASGGDNTVLNHVLKNRGDFTPGWFESYSGMINRNKQSTNGKKEDIGVEINDLKIYRAINPDGKVAGYFLKKGRSGRDFLNSGIPADFPNDDVSYVPFSNEFFPLQYLWEKIALTPLEDDVVRILQVLEPKIYRISIIGEEAKVLFKNEKNPIPLKNLGDGAARTLTLAVALANSKNSFLLIDEFEAGLHESVQEQLWEIIFEYAKKWNIQVFATTHSLDTVKTFFYAMDGKNYDDLGKFFRIQKSRKGKIESRSYEMKDLAFAIETNLELR